MVRRLFTLTAALSLLLFIATAVLWVRSYLAADDWRLSPTVLVKSASGSLTLVASTRPQIYVPDSTDIDGFRAGASARWHLLGFEWLRYGPPSYDPSIWTVVCTPYWLMALATAILPAASLRTAWLTRQQRRSGRCVRCGYDLRASPGRCPECGQSSESQVRYNPTRTHESVGLAITEDRRTLDYGTSGRGKTGRTTALVAVSVAASLAVTGWCIWRYAGKSPGIRGPSAPSAPLESLFPPGYGDKVQKIIALLESAPTSRPSAADADELLNEAAHDPDFRIRVRAMAVLPFIGEREKAIDVLIAAVHERDPRTNGGGNVPLYATMNLVDMKVTRAIPDISDWLKSVEGDQTFDEQLKPGILRKLQEDLARLRAVETQPAGAGEQPQ